MDTLFELWKSKKPLRLLVYTLLFLFILFLFGPFTIIPSGERGLRFTWGALENTVLKEGINLKIPFVQTIEKVTIRPQQVDHDVAVGVDGAITKDNQTIGASVVLFITYKEDQLVRMWRKYGEEKIRSIVTQTLKEDFKKVIGQYTIFEIAVQQEKIRLAVAERVKSDIVNYPIELNELKITNYDWSDSFEQQIEQTMKRAQEVKVKEQELLITEQEAQKAVKRAEADKQATITQAEGEKEAAQLRADAKVLEGEGIRKYNASIAANMQLELEFRRLDIKKIEMERWNGQYVPNNWYGPIPVSTQSWQKPE